MFTKTRGSTRLFCVLLLLLSWPTLAEPAQLELSKLLAKGCVVYYGPEPRDKSNFTTAQVVILEPSHWSTRSLRRLREQGKTVLGYLSVGEIASNARTNKNYQILSHNKDWNSLRVDPSDPSWLKNLLRRTRLAKERELDGMMLDTLDITILHPEAQQGMAALVQTIREEMPDRYLMVNRGFSVLPSIASYIDGVVFENANNTGFNQNDREWVEAQCQKLKAHDLAVLVLDYEGQTNISQTRGMAERFGWSFYLAPTQTLAKPLSVE